MLWECVSVNNLQYCCLFFLFFFSVWCFYVSAQNLCWVYENFQHLQGLQVLRFNRFGLEHSQFKRFKKFVKNLQDINPSLFLLAPVRDCFCQTHPELRHLSTRWIFLYPAISSKTNIPELPHCVLIYLTKKYTERLHRFTRFQISLQGFKFHLFFLKNFTIFWLKFHIFPFFLSYKKSFNFFLVFFKQFFPQKVLSTFFQVFNMLKVKKKEEI